jgi:ribosome biogenesis GTPase
MRYFVLSVTYRISDMSLWDLALSAEREAVFREHLPAGMLPARIAAVDRERYIVHTGERETRAELTGRLFYSAESAEQLPTVGDWVAVEQFDGGDLCIIHDVLPRWSLLRRKAPGRKSDYQLLAANIDVAYIMQSVDGNVNLRRLERYLVTALDAGIRPVLLISKCDLADEDFLDELRTDILAQNPGLDLRLLSSFSGLGAEALRDELRSAGTTCLLGSSGVGKTTLLNALLGEQRFDTQEVRESDGRGRHTTTRRQMVLLPGGGVIIDTPGMRELGTMAADEGIDATFAEIHERIGHCRYRDCTHTSEEGCALLEAVERGEVDEDRYQAYMKLQRESRFHEMSYVEKRKRDKELGKLYKSILKVHYRKTGKSDDV